ncbi:MAG TPA: asparaginase domain-containing protein [Candidatus Andersenbacteria bacterium]|nr:asparaginase domain-containing protein [Candidatus Andersenbacteria bacterium]
MKTFKICAVNGGGTIACAGEKPYKPARSAEELLSNCKIPRNMDVELVDFEFRPDSTNQRHFQRVKLAEYIQSRYFDIDAWLFMQGTDSLARTGGTENMIWKDTFQVPGVVIGTQFTMDEAGSEVKMTLENALRFLYVALTEGIVGWYNACMGKVWRTSRLMKRQESAYDAFHEPGCDPVAFTYPDVILQGGFWLRDQKKYQAGLTLEREFATHVNTLDAYADAPPFPLIDLVHSKRTKHGVILRCEGCGNLPNVKWPNEIDDNEYSWIDGIRIATEAGIHVGIISPFEDGTVDLTRYELGAEAKAAGAISMVSLTQPTGDFKFRQGIARFPKDPAAIEAYLGHDFMKELLPRQVRVETQG